MAEKRSVAITVAIIGAVATIIAASISIYSPRRPSEPKIGAISSDAEQRLRVDLLAEIRKALVESRAKSGPTNSGLAPYDESYIAAVLDAMRGIAEKYEGVEIQSGTEVRHGKVVKDAIEAAKVTNFGNTLRLSWRTSVMDFVVTEDIIRLDVFPNPKKEPAQSFTILVKDFMVETISKDFSIKYLDHALERAGFEIKEPVHFSDGTLEITCQYKNPNSRGGHFLVSKGNGVPSNIRVERTQ